MTEVRDKLLALADDEKRTLQSALNDAMDDRHDFSGAYGHVGPEAKEAQALIARYEALHVKLFGCPSARTLERQRTAALPSITLQELSRRSARTADPLPTPAKDAR